MLPEKLQKVMFESLSVKTMRYVDAVPTKQVSGLLAKIYKQVDEDFFVNGSLTSHSAVPELMAGVWIGGREAIIQPGELDQKTKEAMAATLSRVNDCPYCGDMLISLVHSAGDKQAAKSIFTGDETNLNDSLLESRLRWVEDAATPGSELPVSAPFPDQAMPEAIGTIVAMGHVNRFSHVVMDGSPVPFGQSKGKYAALSLFSKELTDVVNRELVPGRSLELLPPALLPADMEWATSNPRIADAMSRWAAVINQYALPEIPKAVQAVLADYLSEWRGEKMPLSRAWLDEATAELSKPDQNIAKLCLVVAIAPWQFSEDLIEPIAGDTEGAKQRVVKILNFAAFSGARRLGEVIGNYYMEPTGGCATYVA